MNAKVITRVLSNSLTIVLAAKQWHSPALFCTFYQFTALLRANTVLDPPVLGVRPHIGLYRKLVMCNIIPTLKSLYKMAAVKTYQPL